MGIDTAQISHNQAIRRNRRVAFLHTVFFERCVKSAVASYDRFVSCLESMAPWNLSSQRCGAAIALLIRLASVPSQAIRNPFLRAISKGL
jgi:hypothetical protein